METKQEKPKKVKKKGPIRFEAIIPLSIVFGLSALYFKLFFDSHLKSGMEWVGTKANGAEVNIGLVKTSFINGRFELGQLEITDKTSPSFNLISIDNMVFHFVWDALLRAKFVVEEASVDGIAYQSQRKKPGKVLPVEESKGPSVADEVQKAVLDQARKEFDGNILGDLAEILQGTDPSDKLKDLREELQTETKLKQLKVDLENKEKEWQARIAALPKKQDFENLALQAKNIKFGNNPAEIKKALDQVNGIRKEADNKVQTFEDAAKVLNTDVKYLETLDNQIEQWVRDDIKAVQARIKIPNLDFNDFSMALFGSMFAEKIAQYKKYSTVAQKYLPPKKSEEDKKNELTPTERQKGINVKYPITSGYPRFWLKLASISSKSTASQFTGDFEGRLENFSTEPYATKKNPFAVLKGSLPHQKISGILAELKLERQPGQGRELFKLGVGSFPFKELNLSKSDKVSFLIPPSSASVQIEGVIDDQNLDISVNQKLTNLSYQIDSQSKLLKEILQGVTKDITQIDIQARASGHWKKLDWDINSNLGRMLARGIKDQVQIRINEAKEKVNKLVQDKIAQEKGKLFAQRDKIKNIVQNLLGTKKTELDTAKKGLVSSLDSKKNETKNKVEGKVEEQGKKAIDDLKKKIKLKF